MVINLGKIQIHGRTIGESAGRFIAAAKEKFTSSTTRYIFVPTHCLRAPSRSF
jgi:hypothetical protein